ncbi:MAG: FAD-binding oxidoreductase [Pseudomonadota bacterium]
MSNSYDVVIIGGGVIGSATAYFLASNADFDGSVAVIERDSTYENAPSAKATGGIRQQFSTPENIQIGLFGAHFVKHADEYLEVDGEGPGLVFREQGYLVLASPDALPILTQNHATQRAEGADILHLDPGALAEKFPWLNVESLGGGFFGASDEGWLDPYGLLQAFKRKARSLGVTYVNDEVMDVAHDTGVARSVTLRSGKTLAAGTFINSAGASGAKAIAQSLGVEIPVESRLRATFVFECREDLSSAPLTVLPNGQAWRPEGSRFLSNLAPPAERDPERYDYDMDHDQFESEMWEPLATYVPAFEAVKVVQAYCCHYDLNTLDENAILGLLPGFSNAYLTAGFSGHGMQQAPAVGRAMSELITYGEFRSLDLTRFGYERVLRGEGIFESHCW